MSSRKVLTNKQADKDEEEADLVTLEKTISCQPPSIPFTIQGGSAEGYLILVELVLHLDLLNVLATDDIILSINERKISGMLLRDVRRLLESLFAINESFYMEIVSKNSIPSRITEILAGEDYPELQIIIRNNVYQKTVPYTTRPPRNGEIDGVHYKFVDASTFRQLRDSNQLLEHGHYQGHYYGTPKPLEDDDEMVSDPKGPLPPNWEIAYSDQGEKYFVDHNTGTTQWEDPRNLPDGWEKVNDGIYGTFYVDHVNKRTQYERPSSSSLQKITDMGAHNPASHSYAYVNNHDANNSTKTILTNNDTGSRRHSTLYSNHSSPSHTARSIYSFTRDPSQLRGELITTRIIKGPKGLGFTLIGNDGSSLQDEFLQIKNVIPGGPAHRDGILQMGDVLVYVNSECVLGASQAHACLIFQSIGVGELVTLQICRGYPLLFDPANKIVTENAYITRSDDVKEIIINKGSDGFGFTIFESIQGQRVKKSYIQKDVRICWKVTLFWRCEPHILMEIRTVPRVKSVSRTPSAAFRYGEQRPSPAPTLMPRSKTPAPHPPRPTKAYPHPSTLLPATTSQGLTTSNGVVINAHGSGNTIPRQHERRLNEGIYENFSNLRPSSTSLGFSTPNYMPMTALAASNVETVTVNLIRKPNGFGFRVVSGTEEGTSITVGQIVPGGAAADDGRLHQGDEIIEIGGKNVEGESHVMAVQLMQKAATNGHVKLVVRRPKTGDLSRSTSAPANQLNVTSTTYDVILSRNHGDSFGFVIISSLNNNGSTIGRIVERSPAALCGQLRVGDRVVAVNGIDITKQSLGYELLVYTYVCRLRFTNIRIFSEVSNLDSSSTSYYSTSHIGPTTTYGRSSHPSYHTNQFGSPHSQSFDFPQYRYLAGNGYITRTSPIPPEAQSSCESLLQDLWNISCIDRYSEFSDYDAITISPSSPSMSFVSLRLEQTLINVELNRGPKGFGFSIRGGQEFDSMPLFVLRIAEDGPAALDGRLKVGDQLMEINGQSTRGMTHSSAIQIIKQYPTVRLLCKLITIIYIILLPIISITFRLYPPIIDHCNAGCLLPITNSTIWLPYSYPPCIHPGQPVLTWSNTVTCNIPNFLTSRSISLDSSSGVLFAEKRVCFYVKPWHVEYLYDCSYNNISGKKQERYITEIPEDTPINSLIIKLHATHITNESMYYAMVAPEDSRSANIFTLDTVSGEVRVGKALDRETLDRHVLKVTAYERLDPAVSASSSVIVEILDVQDNAPIFERNSYYAEIREDAPIGTTLASVFARDLDIGLNGEIVYSLGEELGAELLQIHSSTGVIQTAQHLDRELMNLIRVYVYATDKGVPPMSSRALLEINLLDVNDNAPVFDQELCNTTIMENITIPSNILKIKASDNDSGQNGKVRYSIVASSVNGFSIDYESGWIKLHQKLDSRSNPATLLVRAKDSGQPAQSSTINCAIYIIDINDHKPHFVASQQELFVEENVPIGFEVTRIFAIDEDSDMNGRIVYTLEGEDNANETFRIDQTTGIITTVNKLDREDKEKYILKVKAEDGGKPPLADSLLITITVRDINDNAPYFEPNFYNITVAENEARGTPLITVKAIDHDNDDKIVYRIERADKDIFSLIHSADQAVVNGVGSRRPVLVISRLLKDSAEKFESVYESGAILSLSGEIDYVDDILHVMISATDKGGLTGSCTITIIIIDVNTAENIPIGSEVIQLKAKDQDRYENAKLTYSVDNAEFTIDKDTGLIVVVEELNREERSSYLLNITVTDHAINPLSASTFLEIILDDINDNAPEFISENYTVAIAEDTPTGTSFAQVSAIDIDEGDNAIIDYYLIEDNEKSDTFKLDRSSGTLRVVSKLDRETIAKYQLTVKAQDRGNPPLSSFSTVSVIITDVNDYAPEFESSRYDLWITENSPIGTTIGTIIARDQDEGDNALIQFRIFGGIDAKLFDIETAWAHLIFMIIL
ncbi:Membrane-associated guanylate kinase, WW and PDZ domain-containing protein 3 [Dirofilaria immitis]|nr:Membrane-associated guanylate kinase, WW and PDZ domain-containing protein 3 [Dirofilaria immitis]